MNRKIVQIKVVPTDAYDKRILIVALCNDGTLWRRWYDSSIERESWLQFENIPEGEI